MDMHVLATERKKILQKIQEFFDCIAIEGHIFGSLARGNPDMWSDVDIWIVFKDEDIAEVLQKRLEYYNQIGEVVHIVEPPQNAPINGVHSAVLYKTDAGLLVVDYYLCPLSTAFITKESKKLFGDVDLALGESGFNPQKVTVANEYRIDFFIGFIFNGIKKIQRDDDEGFEHILKEYAYLSDRYSIAVAPLQNPTPDFQTLEQIIQNITAVATEKQKKSLNEISVFMHKVASM